MRYRFEGEVGPGQRELIRHGQYGRYEAAQEVAEYLACQWRRPVSIWRDTPTAKFPMETIEYTPRIG